MPMLRLMAPEGTQGAAGICKWPAYPGGDFVTGCKQVEWTGAIRRVRCEGEQDSAVRPGPNTEGNPGAGPGAPGISNIATPAWALGARAKSPPCRAPVVLFQAAGRGVVPEGARLPIKGSPNKLPVLTSSQGSIACPQSPVRGRFEDKKVGSGALVGPSVGVCRGRPRLACDAIRDQRGATFTPRRH